MELSTGQHEVQCVETIPTALGIHATVGLKLYLQ